MEEKYYEILRHYVNPNDCATVVKQLLSLHNVSRQRELLIAFHKWQQKMWTNPNSEITENVVDVYLKSNL